jgi:PAS domain S-box-containing protein
MRLQELKNKENVRNDEATGKRVRIFLQSTFYLLDGDWQWQMKTTAVFCSDVMFSLPGDFAGTKAIFHPDDIAIVKEKLTTGQTISSLSFRIITTYGEVKTITGENIVAVEELPHDWLDQAVQTAAKTLEQKAEHTHLQLLKEIDERTSHFSGHGSWYYNAATHQCWYSDFVYHLHGLPAQSLNAHLHTFHPFILPEDKALVTEYTDKAFRDRTSLHLDYRIVAGEKEKWVSYKAHWFFSEKGEEILGGLYQDITEQKEAERETESYKNLVQFQRQQLLYDEQQVAIGHWQINLLTRKTTYSDQYYRIFGLKPQSLLPTINAFLNYIHPDDQKRVDAAYKKIIYEHAMPDLEFRIVRNDGKTRHVLQKARLITIEQELIVSGIIQDITVQRMLEKKVAEQTDALQLRQWLAQQSDEQASLLSWVMDVDENTFTWSESFFKLIGQTKVQPANVTEKTLFSMVYPQDLKAFRNQWRLAVTERQAADFATRFLIRGTVQYMKASFHLYEQGNKTYFIGTLQNNTAEQVLQQQLSQRVQLAESLSENTLDRVIITDTHNTVLLWNRSCEQAYGVKKAEAIGENFFDLFPQLKTEEEMQLFQRVLRGEKVVQEGTASSLGKDYYNLYLMPLYQEEKVSGILHIIHDVTREVELRNSLHDRLQLIEGLVQSSVDRIIALDRNMNYLYWNKSAEAYYGLPKEEVLGKNILEVFPRLINDPSYSEIRRALHGETIHIPINPEADAYFETYLIPIKDEQGEVVSLLWMAYDLSKEWALQNEQRRASQILDTINELYVELDAVGNIRYVNQQAEVMWQKKKEDLLGKQIWDVFPHGVGTGGYDIIQKALTEKIALQGEYFSAVLNKWVFMSAVPSTEGVVVLFHDITERKEAEEQLAEQSHYLRRITETVPDMISVMQLPSRAIRYLNKEIFAAHGFDPDVMLRKSREELLALIHPDDRPVLSEYYRNLAAASDDEIVTAEYRSTDLRGVEKWFLVRGKVFQRNAEGRVTHILNAIENITSRKKAEQEILRLKEKNAQNATDKYYSIFNSIDEGFCIIELLYDESGNAVDYRWLEVNPAYEKHSGQQNPTGKLGSEVTPATEPYWLQNYDRVVKTGESIRFENWHEATARWYRSYALRIGGTESRQVAIVFEDITEQKKAEEQLRNFNTALENQVDMRTRELLESMNILQSIMSTKLLSVSVYKAIRDEEGTITDFEWLYATHIVEELAGGISLKGKRYKEVFPNWGSQMQRYIDVVEKGIAIDEEAYFKNEEQDLDNWYHIRAEKFNDGLIVHSTNISSRKKAEQEAREQADFLNKLTDTSPNAIVVLDLKGKAIHYLNNRIFQWLGYSPEELEAFGLMKEALIRPDDLPRLQQFIADHVHLSDEGQQRIEYRMKTKEGEWIWLEAISRIFKRSNKGEPLQVMSSIRNITERRKSEDEHQKNLAILKQAEELAQIGSWEYDIATGRFNWSEGMYRLFGLPQGSKVHPEVYLNFAAQEDRTIAKRIMKNLKKAHHPFEETMQIKRGNDVRLLKIKGSVVNDESGRPQRMVGVDVDITDIKEAEEKVKETQHWLEQTALASPDAICVYDLQKKQPIYLNNCLANWIGTTAEDLVKMGIEGRLDLIYPDDRLRLLHFIELMKAAKDGDVLTLEYRLRSQQDALLWVSNRCKVFQRDARGAVTHILSILQDITQEKAAGQVLIDLNASLEKKNQELEQKNDEITSFAFVASHDLKEPLRKIHTFSDWLLTKEANLSDDGKQHLQRMSAAVRRLHLLIDDILALTKVHVDNEQTKWVDLNALLQQLREEMKEKIERTHAVIEADPLPSILGAENQLFYLFKNLISNAIKFQAKGSQPVIRIRAEREGAFLKMTIADNGLGIAREYHKKIFEMFRRLHSRDEYEGTGMGLAICKKIMEKHGGKITVESEAGKGTSFICWFPAGLSTAQVI